jgi:hypothetical protein
MAAANANSTGREDRAQLDAGIGPGVAAPATPSRPERGGGSPPAVPYPRGRE